MDEEDRPLSDAELEFLEELGDQAWEGITLMQWKRLIREVRRLKCRPLYTCVECANTISPGEEHAGSGNYAYCKNCILEVKGDG